MASPEGEVSSEVTDRVRSIVRAAEELADAIEREARERAEAQLRQAEGEAAERVATARRQADELVGERRRRIAALSDGIVEHAERALHGLAEAGSLRSRLGVVVGELGAAAARLDELASEPPQQRSQGADRVARAPAEPTAVEGAGPGRSSSAADPQPPATIGSRSINGFPDEPVRPGLAEARSDERREDELGAVRLVARQMAAAGSSRSEVAGHVRRAFGLTDPSAVLNEAFDGEERRPGAESS